MIGPNRRKPSRTCEVAGLRCRDHRPQRGHTILARDLGNCGVGNVGYGTRFMYGQAVHKLRMLQYHQHVDRTAV